MRIRGSMLLAPLFVSGLLVAHAADPPAANTVPARKLSAADKTSLNEVVAQHKRIQARLTAADRAVMDQLTAAVKKRLFAEPLKGDLMGSTVKLINEICPGLVGVESGGLAPYVIGGIAVDTSVGKSPQDREANAQILEAQMAMQRENVIFASVSNVLKTRHDTVKNSINNIR